MNYTLVLVYSGVNYTLVLVYSGVNYTLVLCLGFPLGDCLPGTFLLAWAMLSSYQGTVLSELGTCLLGYFVFLPGVPASVRA